MSQKNKSRNVRKHTAARQRLKKLMRVALIAVPIAIIGVGAAYLYSRNLSPEEMLGKAEASYSAGKLDTARIEFLRLLREDPGNAGGYAGIGRIWLDYGAPFRAVQNLHKAGKLDPKDGSIHRDLARTFSGLGMAAEARTEARSAVTLTPEDPEAWLLLAESSITPDQILDTRELQQNLQREMHAETKALTNCILSTKEGDQSAAGDYIAEALAHPAAMSHYAHIVKGNLALQQGDSTTALDHYRMGSDLAPPYSPARMRAAELMVKLGKTDAAKAALDMIAQQTPDFFLPRLGLTQLAFDAKEFAEAREHLQSVLTLHPDNLRGRLMQASIWIAQGDSSKAVDSLDALAQIYSQAIEPRLRLAEAQLANDEVENAISTLTGIHGLEHCPPQATMMLAQLRLSAGEADAAVQLLQPLTEKHPRLANAQMMLIDALSAADRLSEAQAIIESKIANHPDHPTGNLLLGDLLMRQRKFDQAKVPLRIAAGTPMVQPLAARRLAMIELEQDNLEAALKGAATLVDEMLARSRAAAFRGAYGESSPPSGEDLGASYALLGTVHFARNDWNACAAALKEAVNYGQQSSRVFQMLTSATIAGSNIEEAANQLDGLCLKQPNNVSLLFQLAMVRRHMDEFDVARAHLEKILTLDSRFTPAINNLAVLLSEKFDQPERAQKLAELAVDLEPSQPAYADTLGWILLRNGEHQRALGYLRIAADEMPASIDVQTHYAEACYLIGSYGEAESAYNLLEELIKSTPQPTSLQRTEEKLAEIDRKLKIVRDELTQSQLEAIAASHPKDTTVQLRLAKKLERSGAAKEALEIYENALEARPTLVRAISSCARLLAQDPEGKTRALEMITHAQTLAPEDPDVAVILGTMLLKTGAASDSRNLLQKVARKRPNPAAIVALARANAVLGHFDHASDALQRLLSAPDDESEATNDKQEAQTVADLLRYLTTPGAAKPDASTQRALRADSKAPLPRFVEAIDHRRKNDTEAAELALVALIGHQPEFAAAHRELALLYFNALPSSERTPTQIQRCLRHANKAMVAFSDDRDLLRCRGILDFQTKDFQRSESTLQSLDEQQPLDPEALFYLGMSRIQLRLDDSGRATLRRAISQGLKAPYSVQASELLVQQAAR